MLYFPPGTPYSFSNVGDGMARFIDVAGRVDDWPPRMLYADGTEISSGSLDQLFNSRNAPDRSILQAFLSVVVGSFRHESGRGRIAVAR